MIMAHPGDGTIGDGTIGDGIIGDGTIGDIRVIMDMDGTTGDGTIGDGDIMAITTHGSMDMAGEIIMDTPTTPIIIDQDIMPITIAEEDIITEMQSRQIL